MASEPARAKLPREPWLLSRLPVWDVPRPPPYCCRRRPAASSPSSSMIVYHAPCATAVSDCSSHHHGPLRHHLDPMARRRAEFIGCCQLVLHHAIIELETEDEGCGGGWNCGGGGSGWGPRLCKPSPLPKKAGGRDSRGSPVERKEHQRRLFKRYIVTRGTFLALCHAKKLDLWAKQRRRQGGPDHQYGCRCFSSRQGDIQTGAREVVVRCVNVTLYSV